MSSTSAHAHRHATGPSKHAAAPSERTSRPSNDKGCCQVFYVDEERVARVREAMLPGELGVAGRPDFPVRYWSQLVEPFRRWPDREPRGGEAAAE